MGMSVQWVRYGREAAEALRASIAAAKAGEPLAPVTVVVPSNHVGVAARRLLASGALGPVSERGVGLAAVTFLTPYRLAELLGAPRLAGSGRRPVSTPVIAAALRAALADRPGLFAPVAHHPATETALVAAYRELRDVSPARLDALAAAGPRAADVVRLHRAARARLERAWYDEQDLLLAASAVARDGSAVQRELGAVVVHLPQRLTRHSALLLTAVAERVDTVVLAGTTGVERADRDVVASVARLGPAATPAVAARATQPELVGPGRTRILTASDSDDEVRAAVRAVIDAALDGVPLDRIAILHASPEPYARLVHEQLTAAGIAANGAAVVPLAGRVAGRTLLQLLALPDGGFRRRDVFAWMTSAPLRHHGRWAPVAAWERLSRDAAVVAGRQQWDELLATLAARLDADAAAAEADPDEPAWRAERWRADAERARQLRGFVLDLIDDVSRAAAQPRRWAEHARWARGALDRVLGGGRQRQRWPLPEVRAAERVEAALDRLGALDEVEGPVGLDVFTRTLELELESDLGRAGRFGEGVLVGTVAMGVGLDLDLAIVLGLAEGSFPTSVHDDSLLPDDERERAGDELPLRRAAIDRQHRELLAALAGSQRHLLCVPRGDLRRSSERVPSRWVLDLASQMAGRRWWSDDLLAASQPWVEHVPSFDAGLRHLHFPATDQEHRLRALLADPAVAGPAVDGGAPALMTVPDPALAHGAEVVAARHSHRFTRYDGNLSGLAARIPSPVSTTTSATRLERWADCPFAYLMQYVLSVEAVDNPEEELRITPIDRGSLVHQVLEEFILEVLARPPEQQPSPDQPWRPHDHELIQQIGERVCDEYERRGRTGRPIFWRRDRRAILGDLHRFLEVDSEHRREHRTRPLAAELEFGSRRSVVGPAPLRLPDGRVVQFRGKADRVDIGDDGTLHIVDYKTGRLTEYKDVSEADPDQRGRKLQLPVYGVAARLHHDAPDAQVQAEYWFVSAKGGFERRGYEVTSAVLDQVGTTLGTMVEAIEAGVFPPHPSDKASTTPWVECAYCDPDALGVTELRRQWERKRHDPLLSRFADLAEPLGEVLDEALVDATVGLEETVE